MDGKRRGTRESVRGERVGRERGSEGGGRREEGGGRRGVREEGGGE